MAEWVSSNGYSRPDPSGAGSQARVLANRVPVGPNDTHGSVARASGPPVVRDTPGSGVAVQWLPWSSLTPTTMPRAPPLDHRSCCQTPTRLLARVGLAATNGSTWVSG